jgi:hypothetical protein
VDPGIVATAHVTAPPFSHLPDALRAGASLRILVAHVTYLLSAYYPHHLHELRTYCLCLLRHAKSNMASASSILAALDGPYLSDPEPGPSVPAGTLRPLESQGDLLDPSYNLLKRKLDQIPQLTQAMRFAPTMRTPSQSQGNKRPRYSDAPSANPISLMLGGDEGSSPIRGSPCTYTSYLGSGASGI